MLAEEGEVTKDGILARLRETTVVVSMTMMKVRRADEVVKTVHVCYVPSR